MISCNEVTKRQSNFQLNYKRPLTPVVNRKLTSICTELRNTTDATMHLRQSENKDGVNEYIVLETRRYLLYVHTFESHYI